MGKQSRRPPSKAKSPPPKPKRIRKPRPRSPATNARYYQNKAAKAAAEKEEASAKAEKEKTQNIVRCRRFRSKQKATNTMSDQKLIAPKKDMGQFIAANAADLGDDMVAYLLKEIDTNQENNIADLDATDLANKEREKSVLQSNDRLANNAYLENRKIANGGLSLCIFFFCDFCRLPLTQPVYFFFFS